MKGRYWTLALVILTLSLFGSRAGQAVDDPEPGVARVSLIHGDVSTQRGDSGDWVATTVNAPLVRGDKIATGARSRTEIQLDHANILRLGPATEARIADLTRTRLQVQVSRGTVNFTVFKETEADVEIDTPNVAVRPLGEGTYRLQVNSDSETELTVRKGEAEVSTPQGSTTVVKNQLITIQGVEAPQYQVAKAPRRDDWDEWNKDRDRDIRDARSWRYANRYYTGAHDLDRHGRWINVPGYDWCWTPYVNYGWVPYRHGRWVWEPYWDWTWVSYEPWGWAPYHYGRWFYYSNSWCWWPGYGYGSYSHYGYYPRWAPAYVSFLGFGFGGRNWHFGFGFGFGSIGWLPLGPHDIYYPWYGFQPIYNVVNITNITNIRNITNVTNPQNDTAAANAGSQSAVSNVQAALANANVRRAITSVPVEDFVRGRVPREVRPVDVATLRQSQLVTGTVPAVPTRESLRPVDRPASAAAIPARTPADERFFTRRQPPSVSERFTERAAEIQQMMQRHNPMAGGERSESVARGSVNPGRPVTSPGLAPNSERQLTRPGVGNATRQTVPGGERGAPSFSTRGEAPTSRLGATSVDAAKGDNSPNGGIRPGVVSPERAISTGVSSDDRPVWRRFGTGSPQGARAPTASRPAQESRPAAAPRTKSAPEPSAGRPNWQGFSSAPHANRPPPTGRAPRESGEGAASPAPFQSRPAPTSVGGESGATGGWRQFTPQARPQTTDRRPSYATPQPEIRSGPRDAGDRPGWRSFPSRPEGPPATRRRDDAPSRTAPWGAMYSSGRSDAPRYREAPRSYERPPLEIRKPIVIERSAPPARSYEGFRHHGQAPAARPAPEGARAGGGHSAPAPKYGPPPQSRGDRR